jgi:phosphohistidine phosphatase
MKTLFLLRHAKSSWDDASLSDFERPLNERGLRVAPFMGGLMQRKGHVPDVILSSPAKRARRTAELVKDGGALAAEIRFVDSIYEASPQNLLQVVAEIDDTHSSALLVGHNPGMEGFIRYLNGQIEPMPTAALAVIELAIGKWNEIDHGCGELKVLYRPREEMA